MMIKATYENNEVEWIDEFYLLVEKHGTPYMKLDAPSMVLKEKWGLLMRLRALDE